MNWNDSKPLSLDLGLLLLRVGLAVVFLFHGAQKIFGVFGGHGIEGFAGYLGSLGIPFPTFSAWAAALSEFVGGLALLTGLAFRPLVASLVVTMLVASFSAHGGAFSAQAGGMEYPLTLAIASAALLLTGSGRYRLGASSEEESNLTSERAPLARAA